MIKRFEQVVDGIEVGPHVGLLRPALAHDVDGLWWCCPFADGRSDQRRRSLHLLQNL